MDDIMRENVELFAEKNVVEYQPEHWQLLSNLRKKATDILIALAEYNIEAFTYGSVARGDVETTSDVDIVILNSISSFKVEFALETGGFTTYARYLAMATPNHTPKGIIQLDHKTSVSLPLLRLRSLETQFYDFAGKNNLEQLQGEKRVFGVDKRLCLIEPIPTGHISRGIGNYELAELRKILGVNQKIVKERIRVLKRRDEIGRTGVFVKEYINDSTTFEAKLKELTDNNPAIRRFVSKRQ